MWVYVSDRKAQDLTTDDVLDNLSDPIVAHPTGIERIEWDHFENWVYVTLNDGSYRRFRPWANVKLYRQFDVPTKVV